jgi:translation initiation factor 2 subunit 1
MKLVKPGWPESGELLVGEIKKVFSHGAYVTLYAYKKEGLLHVSEISSKWIKNIRDYVQEGKVVVVKVLKVDKQKGHIDVSIKNISEELKRKCKHLWKNECKAEKLLELAAKRLDVNKDVFLDKVGNMLQKIYGELYYPLEKSIKDPKYLTDLDIDPKWTKMLLKIAKENIKPKIVSVDGYLQLRCNEPDGVEIIKNAILKAKDVEVKYVSAPYYHLITKAETYKVAEQKLRMAADTIIKEIKKHKGTGIFQKKMKND